MNDSRLPNGQCRQRFKLVDNANPEPMPLELHFQQPAKKSAAKRELIAPRGAKRYIRRDPAGRIKESDDVSRSLSQDRRRKAKTAAKPGQGDRGDRKSASKRTSRKKSSARR